MIVIKGKYGHIKVMIDDIDETTREQLQGIINEPMFNGGNIVVMPDCHAGKGCVIGFTMNKTPYLIPNIIGVDIGCGVHAVNVGKIEIDRVALDNFIKDFIPFGMNHRKTVHPCLNDYTPYDFNMIDGFPKLCEILKLDEEEVKLSLGTLGGGNHFIEQGVDDNGDQWIFVHSGSRNFGLQVANYYQAKAKQLCDAHFTVVPKGLEFIHQDSPYYNEYLWAMNIAQQYAEINRKLMIHDLTEFLGVNDKECDQIVSVHNYIDYNNVARKGAIRANKGERCLIPFNMEDGVAICVGKGNPDYNFSAPHGAGRIMSRKYANDNIKSADVDAQMKAAGVFTTTAKFAVDEAKQAYKKKQDILDNIHPTVDVLLFVKPVYNFKDPTENKKYKKNKNKEI